VPTVDIDHGRPGGRLRPDRILRDELGAAAEVSLGRLRALVLVQLEVRIEQLGDGPATRARRGLDRQLGRGPLRVLLLPRTVRLCWVGRPSWSRPVNALTSQTPGRLCQMVAIRTRFRLAGR
jgi:hypothetical protein